MVKSVIKLIKLMIPPFFEPVKLIRKYKLLENIVCQCDLVDSHPGGQPEQPELGGDHGGELGRGVGGEQRRGGGHVLPDTPGARARHRAEQLNRL